ncbi:MAG: AP-3 complex subunit delta [Thelocarpon superellum]|nr:MAG: AP-3 complex subunit delta [Thelocarpon superellum]
MLTPWTDLIDRFEKSLYDLIRGLRNHKGNEKEYIQNSLKECRAEIRGQDMDLKATALLKLVYLEMFGHDMSWASFHVLEVMSSPKYLQKRVGYLGAVQSFGPKTDVLMLATNLLKKDLTSPVLTTMALPLVTIPHLITPSLALSLLPDLLPRLTHSQPVIRKKTIVTLYRLALVYPETLRAAWPKIKERLMDEQEDLTVTVAIVNVICELGWRRPQDFLALAPRLFDLLVDGGNNWMAIKIIKLFATLTPLEPRLVRKLLPPLTSIIQTTPAMSLLYECINGIIQGGILQGAEGTSEGEDIASLCVGKLRGMIVTEGDRNLKYVALLAFEKIVASHPHLVSLHQDVIIACVDDADISIRLRALDLVVGMVDRDNLVAVVGRLMRQLRTAPPSAGPDTLTDDLGLDSGVEAAADSDGEDPEESLKPADRGAEPPPPLPVDYRIGVIRRILDMCSRDTYANVLDFHWYLDVLVQLVRLTPARSGGGVVSLGGNGWPEPEVSLTIGLELQNVAVRVKQVRGMATRAAEGLLVGNAAERASSSTNRTGAGALGPAAWTVGEYASLLAYPDDTLTALLHPRNTSLPAETLATYLQAIPKVFAALVGRTDVDWDAERQTMTSLLIARVVHHLENLTSHPSLEVQERAVEFLELMRLAAEAVSAHSVSVGGEARRDAPMIVAQIIPSLFQGLELNPVAPGAQRKVPLPDGLDLEAPINANLQDVLQVPGLDVVEDGEHDEFQRFYYERPIDSKRTEPAVNRLKESKPPSPSYQQPGDGQVDAEVVARRRAERRERNKDDPFYIGGEGNDSGVSSPLHNILRTSNGADVDLDSIPIMKLDLDPTAADMLARPAAAQDRRGETERERFDITMDENLSGIDGLLPGRPDPQASVSDSDGAASRSAAKEKRSILQVDSSGLGGFSFEGAGADRLPAALDIRRQEEDEQEMARAIKEVERLRLEMQRAAERIQAAQGVPPEGTVVKRKKKKKPPAKLVGHDEPSAVPGAATAEPGQAVTNELVVTRRKKKAVGKSPKKMKKKVREGEHIPATDDIAGTETS